MTPEDQLLLYACATSHSDGLWYLTKMPPSFATTVDWMSQGGKVNTANQSIKKYYETLWGNDETTWQRLVTKGLVEYKGRRDKKFCIQLTDEGEERVIELVVQENARLMLIAGDDRAQKMRLQLVEHKMVGAPHPVLEFIR